MVQSSACCALPFGDSRWHVGASIFSRRHKLVQERLGFIKGGIVWRLWIDCICNLLHVCIINFEVLCERRLIAQVALGPICSPSDLPFTEIRRINAGNPVQVFKKSHSARAWIVVSPVRAASLLFSFDLISLCSVSTDTTG